MRRYVQDSRSRVWCAWAVRLWSKQGGVLNTVLSGLCWDQMATPHDVLKDTS